MVGTEFYIFSVNLSISNHAYVVQLGFPSTSFLISKYPYHQNRPTPSMFRGFYHSHIHCLIFCFKLHCPLCLLPGFHTLQTGFPCSHDLRPGRMPNNIWYNTTIKWIWVLIKLISQTNHGTHLNLMSIDLTMDSDFTECSLIIFLRICHRTCKTGIQSMCIR